MAGTDTGLKWLKRQADKVPLNTSDFGKITPEGLAQTEGAQWRSRVMDPVDSESVKKAAQDARANRREQDAEARKVEGKKKGGRVSSASSRADGIAQRGKTRGRCM